jgi:hypothetical protein
MSYLNRRSILAGLSGVSLTALAGCSSTDFLNNQQEDTDLESYRIATARLAPNPDINSSTEAVLSSDLTTEAEEERAVIPSSGQIRIQGGEHPEDWRENPFLFTVKTNTSYTQDETNTVWFSNRAFDRLPIEPGETVTIRTFATPQQFDSRDQARSHNDILEQWFDNSSRTIFLAPHGGEMFGNTGRQAFVGTSETNYSSWSLYGYGQTTDDARRRWLIPTDEILLSSFRGFSTLSDSYRTVVSFLGMGPEDHSSDILIGGLAPLEERQSMRDKLQSLFSGENGLDESVTVEIVETSNLVEDDPAQITNSLSNGNRGGISITQSPRVRTQYWYEVARSVTILLEESNTY